MLAGGTNEGGGYGTRVRRRVKRIGEGKVFEKAMWM